MTTRLPDICSETVAALLPDDDAFLAALAVLPDWRRRKCEELRLAPDKRRSVAAWLLLRRMLTHRGLEAETLPVFETVQGKPAFDPSVGLHFSLSHADERVMAAVSNASVGCDVERVQPFDDDVAEEALSADELDFVRAQPRGPARDRAFCRIWVRKESCVKAIGRRPAKGLQSFSVLREGPLSGGRFRDLDFGDGYLGACFWYNEECE